jgi:hypothetical protein
LEHGMKIGLVVMDENPADAPRIVRAADRAGVHSRWTNEYYNRGSLTRAAAFAAIPDGSIIGTSVTPSVHRWPLRRPPPTSRRSPGAASCSVWAAAPAG